MTGIKAKLFNKKRYAEKAEMKKTISMHEERNNKHENADVLPPGAIPSYLMDRQNLSRAKVLSNSIKQKRKEKAGKWSVPIPKVRPIADDEMFKVIRSGKRKQNMYKRMVTKVTFVGDTFTRKPPKVKLYFALFCKISMNDLSDLLPFDLRKLILLIQNYKLLFI